MAKAEFRAECVRLRVEDRMSLREISAKTGAPKGTLSYWLKDHPLTDAEKAVRAARANRYHAPRKERLPASGQSMIIPMSSLSKERRGYLAELMVAARAAAYGMDAFKPLNGASVADWVLRNTDGHLCSVQVKWTKRGTSGLPYLSLQKTIGHNKPVRYAPGDFDFIVGYDYETDTAYVFSEADTNSNSFTITIRPDAAERWDKILAFRGRTSIPATSDLLPSPPEPAGVQAALLDRPGSHPSLVHTAA